MIFNEIKCRVNTFLGLVGGCIPCIPPVSAPATVQPWFVPCRNVTGFAATLIVTYLETDSLYFNDVSVYNVRKLEYQANLCQPFAKDKKQHCCGDLVLGWAV